MIDNVLVHLPRLYAWSSTPSAPWSLQYECPRTFATRPLGQHFDSTHCQDQPWLDTTPLPGHPSPSRDVFRELDDSTNSTLSFSKVATEFFCTSLPSARPRTSDRLIISTIVGTMYSVGATMMISFSSLVNTTCTSRARWSCLPIKEDDPTSNDSWGIVRQGDHLGLPFFFGFLGHSSPFEGGTKSMMGVDNVRMCGQNKRGWIVFIRFSQILEVEWKVM